MKPGDFFIGVLDFFAVLLPGSLATWLATRYIPHGALAAALTFDLPGAESEPDALVVGAVFLLVSYLLGHFVIFATAVIAQAAATPSGAAAVAGAHEAAG